MTLVPHPSDCGLWISKDSAADTGVHALLIGISDYPYLGGGREQQTNGLGGQLAVCAATAAQIFQWLRQTGSLAGRPVVSCRLLLGPGLHKPSANAETERAFVDGLTQGWYGEPTFASINAAIGSLADALYAVPEERTAENAVFLYAAGHGLEILANPSLLATDIMARTAHGTNNAIAYEGLMRALATYGLGDGLFLFDCCRNAPDRGKELHIVGQDVLQPHPERNVAAPRSMKYLKATKAADKAYQDPASPRRATIFGHALLEALEGVAPAFIPYDRSITPWRLLFDNLESFVSQRVRELLGGGKPQTVTSGGEAEGGSVIVVAEREPAAIDTASEIPDAFKFTELAGGPKLVTMSAKRTAERAVDARSQFVLNGFGAARPQRDPGTQRVVPDLVNPHVMVSHLPSEATRNAWLSRISITDARTGKAVDASAIKLVSSQLSSDRSLLWLDVEVAPGIGEPLWLTLNRAHVFDNDASLGVVLPRDDSHPYVVRLEVEFKAIDDMRSLPIALGARLGEPKNVGSMWPILWDAQRAALLHSGAAGARLISDGVEASLFEIVLHKRRSPLAAAIASSVLINADRLEPLSDWPLNLTNWFESLPDGPVLWAETIMRRRRWRGAKAKTWKELILIEPDVAQAVEMLLKLERRGPPLLAPVLAMAIGQARYWLSGAVSLSEELSARVSEVLTRLLEIADAAEPDTLFLSLRFAEDDISAKAPFR